MKRYIPASVSLVTLVVTLSLIGVAQRRQQGEEKAQSDEEIIERAIKKLWSSTNNGDRQKVLHWPHTEFRVGDNAQSVIVYHDAREMTEQQETERRHAEKLIRDALKDGPGQTSTPDSDLLKIPGTRTTPSRDSDLVSPSGKHKVFIPSTDIVNITVSVANISEIKVHKLSPTAAYATYTVDYTPANLYDPNYRPTKVPLLTVLKKEHNAWKIVFHARP